MRNSGIQYAIAFLCAGLAAPLDAFSQDAAEVAAPVNDVSEKTGFRIAAWNIEHLGVGEESCLFRDKADFRALRIYAEKLNADVIAIQEVASLKAARRVFPPDEYDVVLADRPNTGERALCWWEPPLTRAAPLKLGDQFTGFAIRKGVRYTVNPMVTGFGDLSEPPGNGAFVAADVTVELPDGPLRLLSVHLRWGCPGVDDYGLEECEWIFDQARVLRGWARQREADGRRYAMLGDFNRSWDRASPYWRIAFDLGDDDGSLTASPEALQIDCRDVAARGKSFIDHVFVFGKSMRERLRFGQLPIVPFDDRNYVISDHCPVFADIEAKRQ